MHNKTFQRFLRVAMSASWLLLLIAGAATVHAAFPGLNGKIAFISNRDGNTEVYVMNADGSGQTNLTNDPSSEGSMAWSADGSKIAFSRERGGDYELYKMNADGSGVCQLTDNPSGVSQSPVWSPDGTKIAFMRQDPGDNQEVYVINADCSGSGLENLSNHGDWDTGPAWSPDGSKIAFMTRRDGNYEIYVMDAGNGGNQHNLTANSANDFFSPRAWSPDGTKIAFHSNRDGNYEIYWMYADGSGLTRLTFDSAEDSGAAWSPDGLQIAFGSNRDGDYEIYVMNANDGSGVTRLTDNSTFDGSPDWQPLYAFSGFFQPVDNLPTLNLVKAGQAIPVKFSLNGDRGLNIFAAGYPGSQTISCNLTASVDSIEETVTPGSSSLSYNPDTETYTYVWKTDKAWANKCRQFVLKLNDGTYHRANFKFK